MPMLVHALSRQASPPPTLVGFANGNSSTTLLTVNKPAGVVAGDLLLLWVSSFGRTVTTPSGWTLVRTQARTTTSFGYLFSRVATAAEGNSYAVSLSGTGSVHMATIQAWRGTDPVNPIVTSAGRQPSTTVNGVVIDFGLAVPANSVAVAATGTATTNAATSFAWAGATELTDHYSLSGSNRNLLTTAAITYADATTMPTTGITATRVGSTASWTGWWVMCVVLRSPA